MQLRPFRDNLLRHMGDFEGSRPFVCNGNPYDCNAFVVGINPASKGEFWKFWNDSTGFDKKAWFADYLQGRQDRRYAISPTRSRLDRIVAKACPAKILETNLYIVPTTSVAQLPPCDRNTRCFDFLLAEIKPKVILLHGKKVKQHFERRYGCSLGPEFSGHSIDGRIIRIAAVPHLSRCGFSDAEKLGIEIGEVPSAAAGRL